VLELFCGIGGCAAALDGRADVVAAVDQNRLALQAYALNFPHPTFPLAIEAVPPRVWRTWAADLWWMSPPCPPYTRRGLGRDLDDPRARSLLSVVERIGDVQPRFVALENVPGFDGSRAHERLREVLDRCGYHVRETLLCPTELGLPNLRRRFYLVAGLAPPMPWPAREAPAVPLASVLDEAPDASLWCAPTLAARYAGSLDIVDASAPGARAACFTSAYGRSIVRSGSYLATPAGLRRFSPAEVLRLLDFPRSYQLPASWTARTAWPLVGNSVSVRAVRWVLSAVADVGGPSLGPLGGLGGDLGSGRES
jgi:site-specific DNA-cytosine methylase